MKTMFKILGLSLAVFAVSCNEDESQNAPMSKAEMNSSANIDMISDDVSNIADNQYLVQYSSSGRGVDTNDYLPTCAEIKVDKDEVNNTWTRVIDFGSEGCDLLNGNVLKGKIILKGSGDFSQQTQTMTCAFDSFYHNNIKVEGTKTFVRELKATDNLNAIHPVCTISENLTFSNLTDVNLKASGIRIREMVEGFDTLVWLDNVFWISGNRIVSSSKGSITSIITSPLVVRMNCNHIVEGVITFNKNGKTATLDYGDGTCDKAAMMTIDGQENEISLGK